MMLIDPLDLCILFMSNNELCALGIMNLCYNAFVSKGTTLCTCSLGFILDCAG